MTDAEYQGTEFTLRHHDLSVPLRSYAVSAKMQSYVMRPQYLGDATPVLRVQGGRYSLSGALGYDENRTAAQSYGPSYLMTKEYDTEFYKSNTFNPVQRRAVFVYDESHVRRLARDPTVRKVYTNGGLKTWRVTPESGNASS
jgi:hypothetical protein